MNTVSLEEAQARLPDLIDHLAAGEELVITEIDSRSCGCWPRTSRGGRPARRATARGCSPSWPMMMNT